MTIDKERILSLADDDFIEELSNRENQNPYKAGMRAGRERIMKEVSTAYKVVNPLFMPNEGRQIALDLVFEFEKRRKDER